MVKLSKKLINQKLVPQLSKGKRGPKCKVGLWRIVRVILYKLKSGSQLTENSITTLRNNGAIFDYEDAKKWEELMGKNFGI